MLGNLTSILNGIRLIHTRAYFPFRSIPTTGISHPCQFPPRELEDEFQNNPISSPNPNNTGRVIGLDSTFPCRIGIINSGAIFHLAVAIMNTNDSNISLALRKLVFHFLSNLIGYDRGDSFPSDFEPNGSPFGS